MPGPVLDVSACVQWRLDALASATAIPSTGEVVATSTAFKACADGGSAGVFERIGGTWTRGAFAASMEARHLFGIDSNHAEKGKYNARKINTASSLHVLCAATGLVNHAGTGPL